MRSGDGQVTRREFIQRAAIGGVALGLGGEFLAACGSSSSKKTSSSPQPLNRDPSTLIVAVDAFDSNFDPASYFVNANGLLDYSMYEGLLRIKPGTVDIKAVIADQEERVIGFLKRHIGWWLDLILHTQQDIQ